MKLKIPCKTEPFYSNSWCIAYMVGKMMKLAFQRIQRFIIWTSQEGVMTKTLKIAQKTRENWRPPRALIFHLPTWLLQFTSILETSHSINITSSLLEKYFWWFDNSSDIPAELSSVSVPLSPSPGRIQPWLCIKLVTLLFFSTLSFYFPLPCGKLS